MNGKKQFLRTLIIVVLLVMVGMVMYALRPVSTPPPDIRASQSETVVPTHSIAGWDTYRDEEGDDITFMYPRSLSTLYAALVDWPPAVQVLEGEQSCADSGAVVGPAGKSEQRIIHGTEYCVTEAREGAAGSMYAVYAYAFYQAGKTVVFTFSLRYPQCMNYLEAEQVACQNEIENLSIDALVDSMRATVRLENDNR